MEKNEFKVYIKDKVLEYLHIVKVFQKEIIENISSVSKTKATIKALKKQNEALGVDDIKPMLLDAQIKDYESSLMEMDVKSNYICRLVEYKTMADLFKVDLNLDEDSKKYLDMVFSQHSSMFVVNNGKVVAKDNASHLLFMDNVKVKYSNEKVLEYILKTLILEEEEEKKKD